MMAAQPALRTRRPGTVLAVAAAIGAAGAAALLLDGPALEVAALSTPSGVAVQATRLSVAAAAQASAPALEAGYLPAHLPLAADAAEPAPLPEQF